MKEICPVCGSPERQSGLPCEICGSDPRKDHMTPREITNEEWEIIQRMRRRTPKDQTE